MFTYECRLLSSGTILNGLSVLDKTVTNTVDVLSTVSIAPAGVVEGNGGTTDMAELIFVVSLDSTSTNDITVAYSTSNGTATAGSDYFATNGTVTIPKDQLSVPIVVKVVGDTIIEPDETLFVTLSNAVGGVIYIGEATGTITNDDFNTTLILATNVQWRFNPNRDSWYGTLTLSNDTSSALSLTADPVFWYEFRSNQYHRLRYPTGPDPSTSDWFYLDLKTQFITNVQLGRQQGRATRSWRSRGRQYEHRTVGGGGTSPTGSSWKTV